jgi:hypothetical protein
LTSTLEVEINILTLSVKTQNRLLRNAALALAWIHIRRNGTNLDNAPQNGEGFRHSDRLRWPPRFGRGWRWSAG